MCVGREGWAVLSWYVLLMYTQCPVYCHRLLSRMSERASSYAHSWLSSHGVEVLLSQQLMDADWTKVRAGVDDSGSCWGGMLWRLYC